MLESVESAMQREVMCRKVLDLLLDRVGSYTCVYFAATPTVPLVDLVLMSGVALTSGSSAVGSAGRTVGRRNF